MSLFEMEHHLQRIDELQGLLLATGNRIAVLEAALQVIVECACACCEPCQDAAFAALGDRLRGWDGIRLADR
jgi:hypothetical protein